MPWLELFRLLGRAFIQSVTQLDYLMIFAVVLFLVHGQYVRQALLQEQLFGIRLTSPGKQTAVATFYGLGGGMLATAIFVVLGFSLTETGIWYVWPLALVLMLVRQRFLCFAYSGGLVGLSSLLFGWPKVHVPALLGLIAALHLVESVLIWAHGSDQACPIYTRTRDGRVVGAFSLAKFWPLPVLALVAVGWSGEPDTSLLNMPAWWPLLPGPAAKMLGSGLVYTLFPIVAALGYGDIAVTSSPEQKANRSAARLFAFSVSLMAVALLANRYPALAFAGVVLSPLGHDFVIYLGRRQEIQGQPLYEAGQHPVVLTVLPGSPAAKMKLMPGDEILAVNGRPVYRREDVGEAIAPWAFEVEIYLRRSGRVVTATHTGQVPPVGIIFAPEGREAGYVPVFGSEASLLRRLWRRLRK